LFFVLFFFVFQSQLAAHTHITTTNITSETSNNDNDKADKRQGFYIKINLLSITPSSVRSLYYYNHSIPSSSSISTTTATATTYNCSTTATTASSPREKHTGSKHTGK
jgi:hypothetical protein